MYILFLLICFRCWYIEIMSVSYNLIIYTTVVNVRGELVGRYLYYDPSYEFLGKEHLPYGILALLLSTCFNILPLLLLLFYPMKWFQKCLNWLRLSHVALICWLLQGWNGARNTRLSLLCSTLFVNTNPPVHYY